MKNHLKTKFRFTLPELALFVLLLAEFCFVAYANFRLIERTLDCDSAMLMTHAAEMWHTKHVFIPSWVMETMLEIDTALLPAVPLYALFGNIYTAFGLANILVLLAYWFFFCSLLKRMGQPRTARLAACILVTIPWSFGQLLYFNMMFFSGGYYGIKVLLPLMLIWLLTTKKEDRGALFYVILALTTFFSFAFSISTGPYSLICVILPLAGLYVWLTLGEKQKPREILSGWLLDLKSLILYAQGIAAAAGILVSAAMHVNSTGSNMRILGYRDFTANLLCLLSDYFELLGAFPREGVKIMSLTGISAFAHFLPALLALIALIALVVRYFPRLKATADIAPSQHTIYYLLLLFLWNGAILLVCEIMGETRYLLMGLVPMIPLIVLFYHDLLIKVQGLAQRFLAMLAVFALLVLCAACSDLTILNDDCNPPMAAENTKYEGVVALLNGLPETQVFFLNDTGRAEILRVLDAGSGREYLSYMVGDGGVIVHDYYESHTDASYFEPDHLLIVNEALGSLDDLPEYLKNCYEEVGEYQGIRIYRASENRMDGACGYRNNEHSVDYAYTPGYTVKYGELTQDGGLNVTGTGEVALSSPWLDGEAKSLAACISYTAETTGSECLGRLVVTDCESGEELASVPLEASSTEAAADIPDLTGRTIVVQVIVNEGATLTLHRLTYDQK